MKFVCVFALLALSVSADPPTMERVKAQVVQSDSFQKHIEDAMPVFCKGAKKQESCKGFVEDAIFCLDFAKNVEKFEKVSGSADEKKHCETIDTQLPNLSMLQDIIASPHRHRREMAMLQQFARIQTWARSETTAKRNQVFLQRSVTKRKAPEDELAKEMTHDLEMNFNKIAPFGKEDTAKELQDHAAKTQDTLVDAVENAEVAEIKRAVFRALTRLRAAAIKEFDTIARLETQAIDAYNDAHHYRAENPLTHLHEDEAPVETDKLKSFH